MSQVVTTDIIEKAQLLASWQEDPVARHYSFSSNRLWSRQEDILWAVRRNKRVCVKSGNTVGKSFIATDLVMDWLVTKHPSKVVTTAASWNQVENILWKEIRMYCAKSKLPLGKEPLQTELRLDDDWFAIGISTDKPVNLQGIHSPHLLVVLDEASGISDEIFDMVEALHPEAILAIGNPIQATGRFAECFTSDKWHKITISCMDCVLWQDKNGAIPGLVTREWVNEMRDIHGVNSPWYRSHVDGEFPEEDEHALIEKQWVERARKGLDCDGLVMDEEVEDEEARIIGCDVASKHGENLTVIGYRYGHTIAELKGYMRASATQTRDEIEGRYKKHEVQTVVVDSDGIGEPMQEVLSEVRVPCLAFHGGYGQKAIDGTKFKNLRTQFYWIVAKKFEKGLYNLSKLDEKSYEILRGQLCSIKVKKPDALGRMQIETKEDMMARQIKSPDFSDTLMMMEYGFFMRRHAELQPMAMGNL